MSNKDIQQYRYIVHKYLDAIWMISYNKRKARTSMYKLLSNKMGLTKEQTHVKYFTIEQCIQAIRILRPMYIQLYGRDLLYKNKE